ncbi:MAG: hypothetical protein Q9171_000392 [Xanthocarpia ochracea]
MKVPFRIQVTINALCIFLFFVDASSRIREPITYLSLVENPEIRTPSHRVHAFSRFDIVFALHQSHQQLKLTLEPNHDIIVQGATVTYLDQHGQIERSELINRHEHRVFKGESWVQIHDGSWHSAGWARVTVKRDGPDPLFEGAFTIGRDHHHVQLRSHYLSTKHDLDPDLERTGDEYMVAYRDSDIFQGNPDRYDELKRSLGPDHSCSSDALTFNNDPSHPVFAPTTKQQVLGLWGSTSINSLFGKRQLDTTGIPGGTGNSAGVNLRNTIGRKQGCPDTRKVALVGVATDCGYTASFASEDDVRENIIQQFQSASQLYERTFSITLGLANLTISKKDCPTTPPADTPWNVGCTGGTSITDRLNMFSQWRGERNDTNAYWTLLTSCPTGSEVGLAWLGQLCVTDVIQSTGEVVSGANVVARTPNEWQVIAHESGHTFGAVHDCDESACANQNSVNAQQCCPLSESTCDAGERFIMNPSTGQAFSNLALRTTKAFPPFPAVNVVMGSSKETKNVTAEVRQAAATTPVANPRPADSEPRLSATIPMKLAAITVSSPALELSAEPALVNATHRRPARVIMQHAHRMFLLRMVNPAVIVQRTRNALAANARLGTSNAGP